jgi:hypothetical protein
MAHALTCRVVQAWGVPDGEDKNRPFVRVKILDASGEAIATQETKALEYGGDNPAWNEYLNFKGLDSPADCTILLEVMDKNDKDGAEPDGVAKVPLSVLLAVDRLQQFREVIAGGWFSNAELRFGLCNHGTWGNSPRLENKLSVTILSATTLREADGGGPLGFFASKNDPYVYLELEDEKGKVLGKPLKTKVLDEAGESAEWNETLTFPTELLTFPMAYKLKLSVWDKDTFTRDDSLGKTELLLSKLIRAPQATEFAEPLEGGEGAILKFAVSNEDTWGNVGDEAVLATASKGLQPEPPHDGYYLKVNVLCADGLAAGSKGNDGKADPVCRITLRDEWGRAIKTVTTVSKTKPKPKAKAKPKSTGKAKARKKKQAAEKTESQKGPDVQWNETFEFRGIHNPGRCTMAINVLDGESQEDARKRLGEHVFVLGRLMATEGPQEFEEDIAGFFWKTTVKFQCDNLGAWGNGEKESNRLYMRIDDATSLPQDVGTIIKDTNDPYVLVELKDDEDNVLAKKQTKVLWNAGENPSFNEELIFEDIEEPSACSVFIRVYDKESFGQDTKLGHTQIFLGELPRTSEYVSYHGTTLGGVAELNFAMHTGGTWGNGTPVDVPDENATPQCCSTM